MLNSNNQIKKNAAQAFDAAHNLMQFSLENASKLANIQLEATKSLLNETTSAFKSITQTSNPQQMIAHVNHLATSTVEKNLASCRSVYEIMTATQQHFTKLFQNQFQASNAKADSVTNWLTKFQATNFDTAKTAINSMVKNANQAINAATALTSQANELASSNIKSTTKAVESVVETAKKAATKNVETVLASAKSAATSAVASAMKATDTVVETVKNAAHIQSSDHNSATK